MRLLLHPFVAAALVISGASLSAQTFDPDDPLDSLGRGSWPVISSDQQVDGALTDSDIKLRDGSPQDAYFYEAQAGETATITMRSPDFGAWLTLYDPASSNRAPFIKNTAYMVYPGMDTWITVTFPHSGRYLILAGPGGAAGRGRYRLSITKLPGDLPDLKEAWARCVNNADTYTLPVQLAACEQSIASQSLHGADLGVGYYNKAVVLDGLHDVEGAIADYSAAIRQKPDFIPALAYRGGAYDETGDHQKASDDYKSAIQLTPNDELGFIGRGFAYEQLGEHQHAIADFSEAIRLKPNSASAFFDRAIAYAASGDLKDALADDDEAVRLRPANADALLNRGIDYRDAGKHRQAIDDFSRYIRAKPDDARGFYDRAKSFYAIGDVSHALADFKDALRLEPALAKDLPADVRKRLGVERSSAAVKSRKN